MPSLCENLRFCHSAINSVADELSQLVSWIRFMRARTLGSNSTLELVNRVQLAS